MLLVKAFIILCMFLTAKSLKEDAIKGFNIGADDYISKPFSMDVYITKLRKFLEADENLQILNVHGQGFKLIELDGQN